MTSQFKIGDIIKGKLRASNEAFHPIIYLGEKDVDFFLGGMMTHAVDFGNVKLENIHYNITHPKDNKDSYFVRNFLVKKQEWGPFVKIGELTNDGLNYVYSMIKDTVPKIWEEYTK